MPFVFRLRERLDDVALADAARAFEKDREFPGGMVLPVEQLVVNLAFHRKKTTISRLSGSSSKYTFARTWKNRFNEVYVKSTGYRMIGLPWYYQIYALRPILIGLMPSFVYKLIHKNIKSKNK